MTAETARELVRITLGVDLTVAPRGDAMQELVALAGREEELRAKVDEVGRDQRRAYEELADAREALVELERHAGAGEKSSAQERRAAETRLATAQQEAAAHGRTITVLLAYFTSGQVLSAQLE